VDKLEGLEDRVEWVDDRVDGVNDTLDPVEDNLLAKTLRHWAREPADWAVAAVILTCEIAPLVSVRRNNMRCTSIILVHSIEFTIISDSVYVYLYFV